MSEAANNKTTTEDPSLTTLAKMSEAVYGVGSDYNPAKAGTADLDGYTLLKEVDGKDGFAAQVFQKNNQVVLAFRGTEFRESDTLKADAGIAIGKNTAAFSSQIGQAGDLLLNVREQHPDAHLTLTGHSLGGAQAQVIGNATGVTAKAFDAPGVKNLIPGLSDQLAKVKGVDFGTDNKTGVNVNTRAESDPVSLCGEQIGSVQTVRLDADANTIKEDPLGYHSIGLLKDSLKNGAPTMEGAPEWGNPIKTWQASLSFAGTLISPVEKKAEGILSEAIEAGQNTKNFVVGKAGDMFNGAFSKITEISQGATNFVMGEKTETLSGDIPSNVASTAPNKTWAGNFSFEGGVGNKPNYAALNQEIRTASLLPEEKTTGEKPKGASFTNGFDSPSQA